METNNYFFETLDLYYISIQKVIVRITDCMHFLHLVVQHFTEFLDIVFVFCRNKNARFLTGKVHILKIVQRVVFIGLRAQIVFVFFGITERINFIENKNDRLIPRTNVGNCLTDNLNLFLKILMRNIHHMK